MNRQERRKAEAATRKARVESNVAFHEAGHAVARLLASTAMGYQPNEAVHSIEISPGTSGVSRDGRTLLVSQAICMGPMVSRRLEEAVREAVDVHADMSRTQLWEAFATAGTAAEREISMRSRMLIDVMGAAAETRHLGGANPHALFMSYACEDDREDFARNCKALGIAADQVQAAQSAYLQRATQLVGRPAVWSAISAIASRLRATMAGAQVAALAWPHLIKDAEAANLAMQQPPEPRA